MPDIRVSAPSYHWSYTRGLCSLLFLRAWLLTVASFCCKHHSGYPLAGLKIKIGRSPLLRLDPSQTVTAGIFWVTSGRGPFSVLSSLVGSTVSGLFPMFAVLWAAGFPGQAIKTWLTGVTLTEVPLSVGTISTSGALDTVSAGNDLGTGGETVECTAISTGHQAKLSTRTADSVSGLSDGPGSATFSRTTGTVVSFRRRTSLHIPDGGTHGLTLYRWFFVKMAPVMDGGFWSLQVYLHTDCASIRVVSIHFASPIPWATAYWIVSPWQISRRGSSQMARSKTSPFAHYAISYTLNIEKLHEKSTPMRAWGLSRECVLRIPSVIVKGD